MPLDTDCFIARSLAVRAAELAEAEGLSVLVAPTLNVTLSWYHMQFPGSMRLSTTTFLQVFREVCDSLVHHGFENLLAVNGHGGNIAALTVAINHYFETTGRRVFLVQWWDLASDVLADVEGPMIHAEEAETSLAIALGQPLSRESQLHPFFPPTQVLRHIQHADAAPGRPSFNAEIIITSNHAATHVDAFGHYDKAGVQIAEMPLDTFCGDALCVDIRDYPGGHDVTAAEVEQAVAGSGQELREGDIL